MSNCPICDTVTSTIFAHKSAFPETPEEIHLLTYSQCPNCDHIFYTSDIRSNDYELHYISKPLPSLGRASAIDRSALSKLYARLQDCLESKTNFNSLSFYEFGPGDGLFLDIASEHNHPTFFNELSEDCALRLEERGHSRNYNYNNIDSSIFILRHILEHVESPKDFLRLNILDKLDLNSFVYIEVPDWSFLDSCTDSLNIEHIHQFTHKSIALLCEEVGLSVVEMFSTFDPGYSTTPNRRIGLVLHKREQQRSLDLKRYYNDFILQQHQLVLSRTQHIDPSRTAFHGASLILIEMYYNNSKLNALISNSNVFDGNPDREGALFLGAVIQHPSTEWCSKLDLIVICSSFTQAIRDSWIELGYKGSFVELY